MYEYYFCFLLFNEPSNVSERFMESMKNFVTCCDEKEDVGDEEEDNKRPIKPNKIEYI